MTCFGKDPAPDEWPVWRPVLLGVVTLFLLLGCFGTWSVMTTITGAIVAAGRIEVAQNRQIARETRDRGLGESGELSLAFIPPIGQRPLGIDIDKDNRPRACQLRLNRQMAGQGRFARPARL